MEQEDKRITEEIRNLLINREEPYEEGNWEIFCERYKREELTEVKKSIYPLTRIWKYTAVAAAIIFMMVMFPLFKTQVGDEDKNLEITNNLLIPRIEKGNIISENIDATNSKNENKPNGKTNFSPLILNEERIYEEIKEVSSILAEKVDEKELLNDWEKPIVKPITIKKNSLDGYALLPLSHGNTDLLSERKWKFGVELSSSLISDNTNFGAGLLTEFKISDKLSFSTGITYTKIDASNTIEPLGISSSIRKVGVESSMQALDIPLTVIYQVNEGLYASIGVSSFTVLTENKAYQYEMDMVTEQTITNPDTGAEFIEYTVVTKEFSEPTKDTDFKGNSDLGYINFSIGKKQKLFGETKLVFEPFLKIPLGSLSNEDVKLMNTGLKLKLMF